MPNTRRAGRPTKPPSPGTRASLGLKVTAQTKERIEAAARQSGRTQSQEAEWRLERSLDREDLLSDAMTLAYGRPLAGLLMMLGTVMQAAGQHAAARKGELAPEAWLDDAYAFSQAARAAGAILETLAPAGDTIAPPVFIPPGQSPAPTDREIDAFVKREHDKPQTLAYQLLASLPGDDLLSKQFTADVARIKPLWRRAFPLPPAAQEMVEIHRMWERAVERTNKKMEREAKATKRGKRS